MANLGDLRLQYNDLGDGGIGALVDAMGVSGRFHKLWYLGLSDNTFSDAGLLALEGAIEAGGLPRLEFLTASSDASSDERQKAVQDVFTRRRSKPRPPP